jgi:hypothetical protein
MVDGEEARRLHAELARVLIRNGFARVVTESSNAEELSDGHALIALIDSLEVTFIAARDLPLATMRNLQRHYVDGIL